MVMREEERRACAVRMGEEEQQTPGGLRKWDLMHLNMLGEIRFHVFLILYSHSTYSFSRSKNILHGIRTRGDDLRADERKETCSFVEEGKKPRSSRVVLWSL